MVSAIEKKISQIEKTWSKEYETRNENGFSNEGIPDGYYSMRVSEGKIEESKAGRLQMWLSFTVLEGEHKGTSERSYYSLENPGGRRSAMITLDMLGFPCATPAEIEDMLETIVSEGKELRVQKKTNTTKEGKVFRNYYVIKAEGVENSTPAEEEEPAPAATEEVASEETPAATEETASEEVVISEGDLVEFTHKGTKEIHGAKVESVDGDTCAVRLEVDNKLYKLPMERLTKRTGDVEPAAEETATEDVPVEVSVGMTLYTDKGLPAKVEKIDEATGKVTVKVGSKKLVYPIDQLSVEPPVKTKVHKA